MRTQTFREVAIVVPIICFVTYVVHAGIQTQASPPEHEGLLDRVTALEKLVPPPGTIFPYGGTTAPEGWAICDGSPLEIAKYQDLFRAIGKNFGGDDNKFKLPNLSYRLPIGAGASLDPKGVDRKVGAYFGSETHKLLESELPPHTHSGKAEHPFMSVQVAVDVNNNSGVRVTSANSSKEAQSTYEPTFKTTDAGKFEDDPFSIMPPCVTVIYIIKL